jgi:lipopolysaccharide export system protein LptA
VTLVRGLASALTGSLAALMLAASGPAAADSAADLFAGFQARSKDPVQVDATSLEIFEEGTQRVSVFSGDVVVRRGRTILKAATIKLYSDLDAQPTRSDAFNRIEAGGKVYVSSGDQTVTGSSAVVDMKTRSIVVSGGVVLTQGGNVITGSRLVVNLATGRARIEQDGSGQIRGIFTPDTDRIPALGQ